MSHSFKEKKINPLSLGFSLPPALFLSLVFSHFQGQELYKQLNSIHKLIRIVRSAKFTATMIFGKLILFFFTDSLKKKLQVKFTDYLYSHQELHCKKKVVWIGADGELGHYLQYGQNCIMSLISTMKFSKINSNGTAQLSK